MNGLQMVLIHVLIIALSIKSGYSIKCFTCDSMSNDKCEDVAEHEGSITAEDCEPGTSKPSGNWLKDLMSMSIDKSKADGEELPLVCQKVVAQDANGKETTYRGCQLSDGKMDPCDVIDQKAKGHSVLIEHCSICNGDECNTSSRVATNMVATLLGVILVKIFLL